MDKSEFDDYGRRDRLYRTAFEEYDSLFTRYQEFYNASSALKRRARFYTYGSTISGAILLFIIGTVVVRGGPSWGTDIALVASMVVTALSFVNAVDNPHRLSNVTYNSGQTLQRVYLDFHYFITVRLPDPDEDLDELEEEYSRLLERKHTVNETTPQLGDKWYKRVRRYKYSWKPKELTEITGEDKEFEVDTVEEDAKGLDRVKSKITSKYIELKMKIGF